LTLVIGLTGGIASGKSTVAQMFQQCGITVVDADVIAKEAVEQGMPAYQKIAETFVKACCLKQAISTGENLEKLFLLMKKKGCS
jgi:dephospho-CoA kinase